MRIAPGRSGSLCWYWPGRVGVSTFGNGLVSDGIGIRWCLVGGSMRRAGYRVTLKAADELRKRLSELSLRKHPPLGDIQRHGLSDRGEAEAPPFRVLAHAAPGACLGTEGELEEALEGEVSRRVNSAPGRP
ncbi:hypothetical protein ACFL5O_07770 [Myxococcota bacterium]